MHRTSPSARFVRSASPLAAEVDGELVMLDPATSRYFGLADTGMRIWSLLEVPQSIDGLVDVLVEEYEVDRSRCETDVAEFLARLEQVGLVTEAPDPA